jgi:hypothetical protein
MRVATPARARDPRPGMYRSEGVEVPQERPLVRGGLLLYHFPSAFWFRSAATITDHVGAFEAYSRFPIQKLNTDSPLPAGIAELDFELVIVHYSLVGGGFYPMTEDHLRWLNASRGHKVLLVQDEHRYCGHRFWFCDEVGFDTLYTCLEPSEFEKVYGARTGIRRLRTNLPGYVSEQMVADGKRLQMPDQKRPIDIGYRGRPLPPYSGRGGLEKYEIGRRFSEHAADSGLTLDIGLEEGDRLYGKDWPRFLSRCKGVLGVESGVSVFDLDDRVIDQYERLVARGADVTLEHLSEADKLEGNVYYRTISPRHFEAAAMRVCQILFEGRYSGILQPMVHYIPLRRDFSNFDEALRLFREPDVRRELTENAYRDLIASGDYAYKRYIESVDEDLIEAGLDPHPSPADVTLARRALRRGRRRRSLAVQLRWIFSPILGRLYRVTGFFRRLIPVPRRSTSP